MNGKILTFPGGPARPDARGSIHVCSSNDGFYTVYAEPGSDPAEIIMGGPHTLESTAQTEAKELAADFGARLLHHGWGY